MLYKILKSYSWENASSSLKKAVWCNCVETNIYFYQPINTFNTFCEVNVTISNHCRYGTMLSDRSSLLRDEHLLKAMNEQLNISSTLKFVLKLSELLLIFISNHFLVVQLFSFSNLKVC